MFTIQWYQTPDGRDIVGSWMASLRDVRAEAKILARIARLESGNFGDWKRLAKGVCELRVDHGPGYRVYFSRVGSQVVLLLCGGDKSTQAGDIQKAGEYLSDFKRRIA